MADSKLTTTEILALCREQDGGGASASASDPAAPAAEETPAEAPAAPEPTEPAAAAPPAAADSGPPPTFSDRPTSTADILAAARAETASAGAAPAPAEPAATGPAEKPAPAKPKAAAPSGPTPSSTSDILAAARAQAAGGGGAAKPAAPAAAPSGAAPKSTSDILAAARAQAGGAPAAAKPAAKAAPAAGKPKDSAASGRPSVQEMLKAVREDKAGADSDAGKPKLPQRPAPSKVRADDKPKRRNFLFALLTTPFAIAWTAFIGASAVAGLGLARFMLPNATVEPPSKFKVGTPGDYPLGTVTTKWKSQFAIWITHQIYNGTPQIYALSTVCTHLGCTPNWLEGEQKFKCPCHGSGFYGDGINFEGPAPRPLERYGIRIAPDGQLEVDKGVKFQEEMQQWNDPASFVATSG